MFSRVRHATTTQISEVPALPVSGTRISVTMVLNRVVSEIFNVEECRDLEFGVRYHSRSFKVVPFGRSCMVSY